MFLGFNQAYGQMTATLSGSPVSNHGCTEWYTAIVSGNFTFPLEYCWTYGGASECITSDEWYMLKSIIMFEDHEAVELNVTDASGNEFQVSLSVNVGVAECPPELEIWGPQLTSSGCQEEYRALVSGNYELPLEFCWTGSFIPNPICVDNISIPETRRTFTAQENIQCIVTDADGNVAIDDINVQVFPGICNSLAVGVNAPTDVSNDCDYVNVGVSVTGGVPPYSVVWQADGSQDILPASNIEATNTLEIPNQSGVWDATLVTVTDSEGNSLTRSHVFNLSDFGPCTTSAMGEINLSQNNDVTHPYGQGCAIEGTFDYFSNPPALSLWCSFTIKNSNGEKLYYKYENVGGDPNEPIEFSIPSNSIPQMEFKMNDVTDIVYLEIVCEEGTIATIPVYMYPDKITSTTPKSIDDECRYANNDDFSTWIYGIQTPNPRDLGSICLGSSDVLVWGLNADVSYSLSIDGSIPVPGIGRLAEILATDLGLSFSVGVGWSKSVTNEWQFSFSECDLCIPEKGQKLNDCIPNVPEATAGHPALLIDKYEVFKTIEYMNCDGEKIVKVVDVSYRSFRQGIECVINGNCKDRCKDKIKDSHFRIPNPKKGEPGYIYANMLNGEAPFTYEWTVNRQSPDASKGKKGREISKTEELPFDGNTLSILEAGYYCYTITDANCCEVVECIDIPCVFGAVPTITNDICGTKEREGKIWISPNGTSNFPITYLWSDGSTGMFIDDLEAGVYSVTVTDGIGCYYIEEFVVENEIEYAVEALLTPSSLCSATGAIELSFGKGGPYTVVWDDGTTSNNLSQLGVGDYCVTITNKEDCVNIECFTIEAAAPITISLNIEQECGSEVAQVEAVVQGGVAPYTYMWTSGDAGSIANSVPLGAHTVLVEDAAGCKKWANFAIKEKPELEVISEADAPQCPWSLGSAAVIVSGGTAPYTYLWNTGHTSSSLGWIGANLYYVDITDAQGCTEHVEFDFTINPDITFTYNTTPDLENCGNGSGTIEIIPTGGGLPYHYYVEGPNGYSSSGGSNLLEGLEAGLYTIHIYDPCGNSTEGEVVLESETNGSPFTISLLQSPSCNNSSPGLGAIDLTVNGTGSYEYQWSNGATTEDVENLLPGTYTVTVSNTEGCEQSGSVEVDFVPIDFKTTSTITHGCSGPAIGAIDLSVNTPGKYSYQWSSGSSTEDISNLPAGTYTVTITNTDGCMEVNTFVVQDETNFEYEVEVVWHFLNNTTSGGTAQVRIISDIFDWGGQIDVSASSSMNPVFYSDETSSWNIENIPVPLQYANISTFYFTYTSADKCVYQGTFDMIPVCLPGDYFSIGVTHNGNGEGACGPGQDHAYTIAVNSSELNYPYNVRVTMLEAFSEEEAAFDQTFIYTGQTSFVITGIPAGTVHFEASNHCDNFFNSKKHTNCCPEFSCDLLDEGYFDQNDGTYFYDFPFFSLYVGEECFDDGCFLDDCSEVWGDLNTVAPTFNCWTGTVTIQYPSGTAESFIVLETGDINWLVQREERWRPPNPGTYFVNITYNNAGEECTIEREVNFYGDENGTRHYNDAIGFNDEFWFSGGALMIPDEFMNAYFGAWICENCTSQNEYIYLNDQNACEGFNNHEFTFFDFSPNSTVDPCNSGGTLTIIDFENGVATIQTVPVPVGASKGDLPNMQPFGLLEDFWCSESGWCLFDAANIYGFDMDKLLLATWATEELCIEVDFSDPSNPNEIPVCDPETNPCGPGYICVNGACYQECEESDDCLNDGNCEDGLCVGESECNPPCDSDHDCINGVCIAYVCDFSIKKDANHNDVHKELRHDLPADAIVCIAGNISNDEHIKISGAVETYIYCRDPFESVSFQWEHVIVNPGSPIIFDSYEVMCGEENNNGFEITFTCKDGGFKNEEIPSAKLRSSNTTRKTEAEVLVHPNPFKDNFDITLNHVEDDFKGQLVLLDRLGQTVTNQILNVEAGYNSFNIDGLGDLPTGVYFILVKKEGNVYLSKKIVKLE